MRIGLGFDAHAFRQGRVLVLGGVEIAGSNGLAGHSDADVATHAIADAVLGAAGAGDLGAIFPNDDRFKDASSLELLERTVAIARKAGLIVGNVDVTVIAETPKLAPYRDQMIENLARALDVDPSKVSVKATSTDGLGFTGRREGIAAVAVVLLEPSRKTP